MSVTYFYSLHKNVFSAIMRLLAFKSGNVAVSTEVMVVFKVNLETLDCFQVVPIHPLTVFSFAWLSVST